MGLALLAAASPPDAETWSTLAAVIAGLVGVRDHIGSMGKPGSTRSVMAQPRPNRRSAATSRDRVIGGLLGQVLTTNYFLN